VAASEKLTEEERAEFSRMKRESISRSVQALNRAVAEGRLQPHASPSGVDPTGHAPARRSKPSRQGGSIGSETQSDREVRQ
jgi:hypothetical protein